MKYIIQTKRLSQLQAKSSVALDLVTRTIEDLKHTNEEIAQEQDRIAEVISVLNTQRTDLLGLRDKNTRIIDNFTRLIEGDTEI